MAQKCREQLSVLFPCRKSSNKAQEAAGPQGPVTPISSRKSVEITMQGKKQRSLCSKAKRTAAEVTW